VSLRTNLTYAAILAFAVLSLYASYLVPSPATVESQAEKIFLLSAGAGALVALSYSIVRNLGSLSPPTSAGGAQLDQRIRRPSLKPLTEDRLVRFVTARGRLKKLAEFRAKRFSLLLSQAGVIGNPYTMAARSITNAIMTAAALVPAAALLSLLVWRPLALLVAVPALVYVYPEVQLRSKRGERQEGVERELPFFSILVNVLGSAGVPLYTIFRDVADTRIFRVIRGEALLVKRDVEVFGMDPNESFERLASYHPSKKFSTLLYGYTAKVRSGGDIPSYLTSESGSLLRGLEESWTMYASRAGIIGSLMVTVFGVLPLLLLVLGIFSPATAVVGLTAFAITGVPTFTIMLVFMAGRMQPVGEEPLTGAPVRSLLLSMPGLALGLLTRELWLGAASMLFLFFTVYGYSVMEQRREAKEIDEALPEFMKDVMEFKRQEYDLNRAVLAIAAHDRYTPSFDRLLSRIAAQLKMGTPLDEVTADPRTRLGRMTFFILGQMSRSGGGTIDTVYQLTAYTTKVVEMKRTTQAEMRPYMMLSYISPLLLAFGITFIGAVITSFSNRVRPGLSTAHLGSLSIGTVPPQLFQVSYLLIVVSAAALGIIGAKMTDFTVKNTLRASVNVVIAVVATYALTALNLASLLHFGV
jgi:flagellar protein FlaJ